jgi:hypothetical protein
MQNTAATSPWMRSEQTASSATDSTARPAGEPVELLQQFRRAVDGEHANAAARERNGMRSKSRAEIDDQRARGQRQAQLVELGLAGVERRFDAPRHPGIHRRK